MFEARKGLIFVVIVFCLFIAVNSTSASNYYVNKDTSHKNITDWIKNDAKKGDNLIFNTSSYSLSNTLVISKSINIKSYKNTKINFNRSKSMFYVTVNSVNFSGLILNHKPLEKINYSYDPNDYYNSYNISSIKVFKSVKHVNFKNISIFANINVKVLYIPNVPYEGDDFIEDSYYEDLIYSGISIKEWKGNVKNCHLKIINGRGINALKWTGNLTNSTIKTTNDSGIRTNGWIGNIVNSNFESKGLDVKCLGIWGIFNGDIKNSKFLVSGKYSTGIFIQLRWNGNFVNSVVKSKGKFSSGLVTRFWTGTILKSKLSAYGDSANSLYNWAWWKINIKNSKFLSNGVGSTTIHSDYGTCKISKTRIYGYGSAHKKYPKEIPSAIELFDSKGTISQSKIKQKSGYAIKVTDDVNVINCKITSKKGLEKIFRLRSDLKVINVSKSKNTYIITVDNIGQLSSKACYLSFKAKNVYKIAKISKIRLEPMTDSIPSEIKITIPKKYANNHYTKTIKLDIYYQNKEYNKKNNLYKFKF
ncbi:MAG: hypothetical protein FWH54_04860 [Methanobrevibacter sp.]|nr:hypothetical protein [Methanobrevibacter sp.]